VKALQEDAKDRLMRPRVESEPPDEGESIGTAGDEEAEYMALTSALEKLEAQSAMGEKTRGEETETQRAILMALLKKLNSQPADDMTEDSPPLSIVFDRWRAERQPPAKTWEEWNTAWKRFEAVIGADLAVRSIAKGHVRAFKDALLNRPARRRGIGPDGEPAKLAPASIQKQLNAVKSVLSWAVAQGYLDVNPATGISHARASGSMGMTEGRRLPYDADDLRKLFGAIGEKQGADHWLPLLGLWTGARPALPRPSEHRPHGTLHAACA
jgi:hypothetical protein